MQERDDLGAEKRDAACDCGYFDACECIKAGTVYEDREARQGRVPGSPDSPAVASVPTQGDSLGAPSQEVGR